MTECTKQRCPNPADELYGDGTLCTSHYFAARSQAPPRFRVGQRVQFKPEVVDALRAAENRGPVPGELGTVVVPRTNRDTRQPWLVCVDWDRARYFRVSRRSAVKP